MQEINQLVKEGSERESKIEFGERKRESLFPYTVSHKFLNTTFLQYISYLFKWPHMKFLKQTME